MTTDSTFKRMVLLPEPEYFQLKQCSLSVSGAHKQQALIWPVESSSEREQKLYAVDLAKLREKTASDDARLATTTSPPSKTSSFTDQVLLFPTTYRARAQRLLFFLEKQRPTTIDWKDTGEVIFGRHESAIEGTNIVDLIQHATVPRRRNYTPRGWIRFLNILKNTNVPNNYLNKFTQEENGENIIEVDEGEEEELIQPSAKRRKVIRTPTSRKGKAGTTLKRLSSTAKDWISV